MLIQHGRADTVVPFTNAEDIAQRVTRVGGSCTLLAYNGASHGFYTPGNPWHDQVRASTVAFFRDLSWIGSASARSVSSKLTPLVSLLP